MKLQLANNTEYSDFLNLIRIRLNNRKIREIKNRDLRPAAVFMLIMNIEDTPHVLLTKRTEFVKDHKGQVSFPGGAFDKDDKELLNTAYRETFEEVGIPRDKIEFIGRFDDYIAISRYKVATFIGSIEFPYEVNINKYEIDEYFETPLSIFINLEYSRVEMYNYNGTDHRVFFYNHKKYLIWGLTARILTDFAGKILLQNCSG